MAQLLFGFQNMGMAVWKIVLLAVVGDWRFFGSSELTWRVTAFPV